MKKKLFVLFATAILVFAFSITCFAKSSPSADTLPAEHETDAPGRNISSTSPKTGVNLAGAFVAIITATGVILVSKKKYSEAE